MKLYSVYNLKGGVGKTSTAVNLAYLCAREGRRTLLWDLDPQAATTFCLRVQPKIKGGSKKLLAGKKDPTDLIKATDFDRFDLLPGDFSYRKLDLLLARSANPVKRLRQLLRPLARDYDVLFFDCAPGISTLSEVLFELSDALILPVIPTPLALRTLAQLEKHLEKKARRRCRLLPFFNLVDQRKSLHRRICEKPEGVEARFLTTRLPSTTLIEQMGVQRAPVPAFAPRSAAARTLQALWNEIRES